MENFIEQMDQPSKNRMTLNAGILMENATEPRSDGPAHEHADGSKYWYINGNFHRTDGPAIEWADGTKEWYLDGKRHRADGPAIEYADGSKYWYINDKCHRMDGPAVEYANGEKRWYINGKQINLEQVEQIMMYDLNPDWTQWTDSEKILFRLAI